MRLAATKPKTTSAPALNQAMSLWLSVGPWMLPKSLPTTSAAAATTPATMPIKRSRSRGDFISSSSPSRCFPG